MDKLLASPQADFMQPDIRGSWLSARPSKPSNKFVSELATLRKLTAALSQAGVPLLAGTDSPGGGMVPGASVDDDLDQLVAAGLTPFQALSAATRRPVSLFTALSLEQKNSGRLRPANLLTSSCSMPIL
jgi:imidazolonepropionase-like amidohydrolase